MGTVADMGRAEAVGQATRGEIFSQMLQHPRYLFRPWIPFVKAIEGEPFARQRLAAPVLDLACADGIFAWATYPGPLDVGMDLDLPALAEARRLGAYRHLAAADARALPFRSESFPTITSVCAVEHMDGLPIVLGELSRVLAPAGRLFLTVPSEQFGALLLGSRIWRALGCPGRAAAYGARKNSRSHHVNILGEEGWGQALKAASLTVAMDFHREGGSEGRTLSGGGLAARARRPSGLGQADQPSAPDPARVGTPAVSCGGKHLGDRQLPFEPGRHSRALPAAGGSHPGGIQWG